MYAVFFCSSYASMLGGFVPRRFYQFSKEPAWCLGLFMISFWLSELTISSVKFRSRSFLPDPNRHVYGMDQHH